MELFDVVLISLFIVTVVFAVLAIIYLLINGFSKIISALESNKIFKKE